MEAVARGLTQTAWAARLYLPAYQVAEAARYAGVSPSTVAAWHKASTRGTEATLVLHARDRRASLCYLQLIEVAVVAALRAEKVPLARIAEAREYMATVLKVDYPFARYAFKTDGRRLWMDYTQVVGKRRSKGKLLGLNHNGQLAWDEIIGNRLKDFEYGGTGVVIKWKLAGPTSRVLIDPRVAFGAPAVQGTPTWIIAGRRKAGQGVEEIAEDFSIDVESVLSALQFEEIPFDPVLNSTWIN
jgi:uncharacterized protein (DUF433 family)/transcriptional regulator with XRE-family HTH domain